MRGLTIIVVAADPDRFAAALTIACASAALGARTRLYADEHAVPLLTRGAMPGVDDARALSVDLLACQTGLATAGLTPDALAEGVEMTGLVGVLASLADDRLITV